MRDIRDGRGRAFSDVCLLLFDIYIANIPVAGIGWIEGVKAGVEGLAYQIYIECLAHKKICNMWFIVY